MRSLFGASPHRGRKGSSRESSQRGNNAPSNHHQSYDDEQQQAKRRSFAFMKYSPDRRTSASMKASREHAKMIAMQLGEHEEASEKLEAAPTSHTATSSTSRSSSTSFFQPAFPEPAGFGDFDPFGHNDNTGNAKTTAAPAMEEDFFAQAPAAAFSMTDNPPRPASYHRKTSNASSRKSSIASSNASAFSQNNSFDESVGGSVLSSSTGAYDMDFLAFQSQAPGNQAVPQDIGAGGSSRRSSARGSKSKGRPPRAAGHTSSEASFGSQPWPQQHQPQAPPPPQQQQKSMATFPSNSSMQSTFAGHPPPQQASSPIVSHSPVGGGGGVGGAAARRRMRNQMRLGSSGSSVGGESCSSFGENVRGDTPPASPMSGRRIFVNKDSNNNNGINNKNRVPSYNTISGNYNSNDKQQYLHPSPSPSRRGSSNMSSGASVCSSVAESDIDLFDNSHREGGGFTFDAFGLDPQEIDREVQEAMQALAGTGYNGGGGFPTNFSSANSSQGSTTSPGVSNNKNIRQPDDSTMDDFEPQPWDSPAGSRRPSPARREPQEEEDDGFVDGFRVSKPMPLPLVSVHRGHSPASSERSSSVSSITDQNTDIGAPRRNVFKEKAGFLSSATNNRRPATEQQAPQKKWTPPPGAIKMLTPPRPQAAGSHQRQPLRQEQQPNIQQISTEEETGNYWQSELDQLPEQNQQQHVRAPPPPPQHAQQREQPKKATGAETPTAGNVNNAKNQWRSAAAKYAAPPQPGMPQPSRKYSQSPSSRGPSQQQQRKQKEEEKKDDEDNHTATTATVTTQLSDSPRQQARQEREDLENLETDFFAGNREAPKEKVISPQEQRKMELEALRNGTLATSSHSGSGSEGAGFKSAAALHHVRHDSHKLKPQQERANDCNNQRTSFASIKERLKSPVDHQPSTTQQQSSSGLFRATDSPFHQSNSATKSEVGVSSFTRQKMKVASMSSPSKSEAGYGKSPRNQQHSPEVNAVLNRMKGGMYMESSFTSPKPGAAHNNNAAPNSAPAFMGVKLRKAPSALGLSGSTSGEYDQSYTVAASADSQDQQHDSSHGRDTEHGNLSYRERREMELRALEEEEQPAAAVSPRQLSQAQKMAQQQQQFERGQGEQGRVPSPKRLSYRERREQELARERQMQQQQGKSQNTEDAPKRDVADLIRRRIAANKGKNDISPTNGDSPQQEATVGRSSLRATGVTFDDQVNPSMSGTSDEYLRGYDNVDTPRNDVYEQQQRVSPQHSQPSSRHSDSSPRHDQRPQTILPARPSAAGGLSSLHAQLKQLQGVQDDDEEFSEPPPQPEPDQPQGPRAAPKRVQALMDGKSDDKNLALAHSHSSEHHSSPSRTPKATYAMLNAFLHGRESITSDEQPTPIKGKEGEDTRSPPGSPPKSGTSSAPMSGTALKDDPKYARYFTMLKIGMPMDVVKHAMVRDNLDPNVMDGDHSKPACTGVPLKDDPKVRKANRNNLFLMINAE